ncbi:hypothetical protein SDC9_149349 [bioreactor metagenome]|uniref:Uncharacterized protein n=1 Tax=bioreactor metagenome TaxID=1076179 RepID=A0A645EKZ2_9ZZZZ
MTYHLITPAEKEAFRRERCVCSDGIKPLGEGITLKVFTEFTRDAKAVQEDEADEDQKNTQRVTHSRRVHPVKDILEAEEAQYSRKKSEQPQKQKSKAQNRSDDINQVPIPLLCFPVVLFVSSFAGGS